MSTPTATDPRPGENWAMVHSRQFLAVNIEDEARRNAHELTRGELEEIYADTVAAYRPILAGFLVDIIRRTGAPADDMATAIIESIPRLVAALPDEQCATAVAAAWNAGPFPLGVEGADARCRVWLYAYPGRLTGGRIYAVDENGEAHPLAVEKKPSPA